jgi:hypothetical protein
VRALTRVEDVAHEAELLELARSSTASQLERIVRGYRRVLATEAADAHERRFLSLSHEDDGSVTLRGRLSREEGALVMKALEAFRSAPEDVSAETSDDPVGARKADALVSLADHALATEPEGRRSGGDRCQVVIHVDVDTLGADAAGGRCELDDQAPLATETARRLCCDASLVGVLEREGHPLSVGRKTRSIPPALRRALRSRDGGCQFPGCTRRLYVDAHHIEHWADGGETALTNLVELCRHHHRLVHEGDYRIEGTPDSGLTFRRPDGRRLPQVPRPRGDCGPRVPVLPRRVAARIAHDSCLPRWYGEALNLHDGVQAVLATTGGSPPAADAPVRGCHEDTTPAGSLAT